MSHGDHTAELVGVTILDVKPIPSGLGEEGEGGILLRATDGRLFRVEGDPTIGSRAVWVWLVEEGENSTNGQ